MLRRLSTDNDTGILAGVRMKKRLACARAIRNQRRGTVLTLAITIAVVCGLLLAAAGPAQAQGCSLPVCVSFVTTYDPDGSGGLAPTTRQHHVVSPVWYALDVDGSKAPTIILTPILNLRPIAPAGYEIAVNVLALDAAKPTITIERPIYVPPTTPRPLPLRIELVRGSSTAGWTSLGYDALGSEAPRKLVAKVDLTNRDANAKTDQVLLDAAITDPPSGAGKPFVLVSEQFGGVPHGTRTDRKITRLQYSGNGGAAGSQTATRIPGRVTADVTSPAAVADAPQRSRVILTRDAPTKLDFELSKPGKSTTGTVEELPARIDLTIADTAAALDVDIDQDGNPEATVPANKTTIDYDRATSVARKVVIESREGENRKKATIDDLPKDAVLTYTTPKFPADSTAPRDPNLDRAPTTVTYHADSRATSARLESDSVAIVDGVRKQTNLAADIHNPPANVDELTGTPVFGADPPGPNLPAQIGDKLTYRSDARADELTIDANFQTGKAEKRAHAHVVKVPADIDLVATSAAGEAHADYTSPGGGAERADFAYIEDSDINVAGQTDRSLKLTADSAPGSTPTVGSLLPEEIHIDAVKAPGALDFDYSASSPIESVVINAANLPGLPDRINNLNVVLDRVPKVVGLDTLTADTIEKHTIIECYTSEKCPDPGAFPDCDFEADPLPDECKGWPTTTTTTTKKRSDITITSPEGRLGSAAVQLASTMAGAPDEQIRLPLRLDD